MRELKVGIIGWGFMGRTHAFGCQTIPFYYSDLPFIPKLHAVCTRRESQAAEAQQLHGFRYAATDYRQLLADPDIDVVSICTPNNLHKDMVIEALRAGKHIYCEKPLTVSSAEAQTIAAALKEAQRRQPVHTQMVHQYRFYPATLKAKQLIDTGRIGRVLSFRAEYLHSGSVDPEKPIGWKQDRRIGGGGVLFDLGSHLLDLFYHFMGPVAAVSAATATTQSSRPDRTGQRVETLGEDLAIWAVRMADGSLGSFEASKIATGTDDELRFSIHGELGALRFNLMEPNYLEFYDNQSPSGPYGGERGFTRLECTSRYESPGGSFPSPKASIGWLRGHVHCLYSFLHGIHTGKPTRPDLQDGAYIQYVMEQAYRSAAEGKWIGLKESGHAVN